MNYRSQKAVIVLGLLIVGLFGYLATIDDLSQSLTRFTLVYSVTFICYLSAVFILLRLAAPGRRLLFYIFFIAVVARAVNVAHPPTLSNDIYRYLWEGRVAASGVNPFTYPPEAAELHHLRDENYASINHKELETIYPPAAQSVFLIGALLAPHIVAQKVIFTLFDLSVLIVVMLLLKSRGRDPALCAIYGWSPLVVLEFSRAGHMDAIGMFFLMAALLLFHQQRHRFGFVLAALSFLSKYTSVILLPFFVQKRRYLTSIWVLPVVIAIGYLPFLNAGEKLFSSTGVYGKHWHFNSPPFVVLSSIIANPDWVRTVLAATLVLFCFVQGYRQRDVVRYAYMAVGCSLVLSPTVYPWYLCWMVPFLCFFPSRGWLVFTGTVVLSYFVWATFYETGAWLLDSGIMWAEYGPVYALLLFGGARKIWMGRARR